MFINMKRSQQKASSPPSYANVPPPKPFVPEHKIEIRHLLSDNLKNASEKAATDPSFGKTPMEVQPTPIPTLHEPKLPVLNT